MSAASSGPLVLVSGGMDSVTALYLSVAKGPVAAALSFDYGAKHNARELPCAAWHAARLSVRHIVLRLGETFSLFQSSLLTPGVEPPDGHYTDESMRSTVVPFRNGIFLSIAAGLAESLGAGSLVIAAHSGDHPIYPDCRPEFLGAMACAISMGTCAGVRIERPFELMNKADILRSGHALGVDYARTWSCYKGRERHCGRCGTCVERREAFALLGLSDPTTYDGDASKPARPVQP